MKTQSLWQNGIDPCHRLLSGTNQNDLLSSTEAIQGRVWLLCCRWGRGVLHGRGRDHRRAADRRGLDVRLRGAHRPAGHAARQLRGGHLSERERKRGREKGGGGREREGKKERKSPVPSHLNAAFSWFYSCSLTCPVRPWTPPPPPPPPSLPPPPPLLPPSASLLCSHCSALPQTPSACLSVLLRLSACLPLCQSVRAVSVWMSVILFIFSPVPVSALVPSQVEMKKKVLKGSLQYVGGHAVSHSSILATALSSPDTTCKNKDENDVFFCFFFFCFF